MAREEKILIIFKEKINSRLKSVNAFIRKAIIYDKYCIALVEQYKSNKYDWYTGTIIFGIYLRKKFRFGSDHGWYDGPHCSFTLGFIQFYWQGNLFTGDCKKCTKGMR